MAAAHRFRFRLLPRGMHVSLPHSLLPRPRCPRVLHRQAPRPHVPEQH
jgi:hypothetical protein